jgi:hypothetical protein
MVEQDVEDRGAGEDTCVRPAGGRREPRTKQRTRGRPISPTEPKTTWPAAAANPAHLSFFDLSTQKNFVMDASRALCSSPRSSPGAWRTTRSSAGCSPARDGASGSCARSRHAAGSMPSADRASTRGSAASSPSRWAVTMNLMCAAIQRLDQRARRKRS